MEKIQNYIIADCHCDTLWFFKRNGYRFERLNPGCHIDLPRLREGRVKLQFFAVCVAADTAVPLQLQEALRYIARYRGCLEQNRSALQASETAADLVAALQEDKIGCLLALEGAEPLDGSPELLDLFYTLGVRCISLTWNKRNLFADGCAEEESGGGLTKAGRRLIGQMAERGLVLDLAHLSTRGFFDALHCYGGPVLVSHTNARALNNHPRNLSDTQLRAVAANNGVIGLSFYPPFVSGNEKATLEQLLDHFVHVASTAGVEHLALGSDFDGITATVEKLEDASCYGALVEGLYRRGFAEKEVQLITAGNVRRLLQTILAGPEA